MVSVLSWVCMHLAMERSETLLEPWRANWFRRKVGRILNLHELHTSLLRLLLVMFPLGGMVTLKSLR